MKRIPKIGDIVIFKMYGYLGSPAIVTALQYTSNIPENRLINLFVMTHLWSLHINASYSEEIKDGYWSWPEEEAAPKECEHAYISICLPMTPPVYRDKCFKFGDIKEPETQVNKAEELIDKIYNIATSRYEFGDELKDIMKLIKEYKSK